MRGGSRSQRSGDLAPAAKGGDILDGDVGGVSFETQVTVIRQKNNITEQSHRGIWKKSPQDVQACLCIHVCVCVRKMFVKVCACM